MKINPILRNVGFLVILLVFFGIIQSISSGVVAAVYAVIISSFVGITATSDTIKGKNFMLLNTFSEDIKNLFIYFELSVFFFITIVSTAVNVYSFKNELKDMQAKHMIEFCESENGFEHLVIYLNGHVGDVLLLGILFIYPLYLALSGKKIIWKTIFFHIFFAILLAKILVDISGLSDSDKLERIIINLYERVSKQKINLPIGLLGALEFVFRLMYLGGSAFVFSSIIWAITSALIGVNNFLNNHFDNNKADLPVL